MSIAAYTPASPSVAIVGMDGEYIDDLELAVVAAGGRVTSRSSLDKDQASEGLLSDVLVVDADGPLNAAAVAALRAIGDRTHGLSQLIVRTALTGIDAVVGAAPEAELVVGRDPLDLHLALAGVLQRARGGAAAMRDVASDEGLRLQRLADEIARIARTLVELPEGLGGNRMPHFPAQPSGEDDVADSSSASADRPVTAGEVRAIIRLRRMRDRFFAPELFADPAWDMLLDLAAARIERVRVAVSSLCIAAAVPPTTALRWIKAMTDRGLLRRVADPHDARRIFIQLSDDAALAMDRYLRAARVTIGTSI